jgi:hypothetical protein
MDRRMDRDPEGITTERRPSVVLAHVDEDEDLVRPLVDALEAAGYRVVYRGSVLVGESIVAEVSRALAAGAPVVLCVTIMAVGTGWAYVVANAAQLHPRSRVFAVEMQKGVNLAIPGIESIISGYWVDSAKATADLLAQLKLYYPAQGIGLSSLETVRKAVARVASIYSSLGARVYQDPVVDGLQLDLIVEEKSGLKVMKRAVECKLLRRPVGRAELHEFLGMALLLQQKGSIDAATLVAPGFTEDALRLRAELADSSTPENIELVTLSELEERVAGHPEPLKKRLEPQQNRSDVEDAHIGRRIFVVMPFTQSMLDVYLLGISETASKFGYAVERADEVEHNVIVAEMVAARIRACDVVIAEVSSPNPNVYYEVGYAHACEKETVLLARDQAELPFDTRHFNHILYSSIVDLRQKLEKRLSSIRPAKPQSPT